jgi:hypothetical protein
MVVPKSGKVYLNCQDYFSVVPLTRVDTDAVFSTVLIGDFGWNIDGSVFRASTLGQMLEKE